MKSTFAKAILIITEAGVDLLVEEIKKRIKRNGNSRKMDGLRDGCGAYDQRNRSADNFVVVGRRAEKSKRVRRRSISKG